jgi:hypothetical protein
MWSKEAPKEPGFYWFRYPQMDPIDREDNPTIARVMKSLYSDRLTVAFPGNDECPRPEALPDGEWWSERISPPGGGIRIDGAGPYRATLATKETNGTAHVWYGDGDLMSEIHGNLAYDVDADGMAVALVSFLNNPAKPGERGYKENAK